VTTTNPSFAALGLHTATLQNAAGNWIAPTAAATQLSLGALAAPSGADRSDPFKWVGRPEGIYNDGGPVVNPIALPPSSIPGAYPIVGTTNFMLYTCYASDTVRGLIANNTNSLATQGYMNYFYAYGTSVATIIRDAGFVAMPSATRTAIRSNFMNGGTGSLRIRTAPASGVCTDGA
jgi:hypothetical protein